MTENQNIEKPKILIIVGPTAVGKTKYAIATANALDGEIVSADSMQLYRYMDVGSAKPTQAERRQAVHHLVDQIDPRQDFSAAMYQKIAKEAIKDIFSRGKLPIISGGTGLYVNSLIYDMDFASEPGNREYRQRLEKEASEYGSLFLHNKLESLDSDGAQRIHPNNTKKIIRALEVLETAGRPIKSFKQSFVLTKDYDFDLVGLTRDRSELYDRIDGRVDSLMASGLTDEVKGLLKMGLSENNISMKGIGYKEIIGFLNGEYDEKYAIYLIKRNSRHYAKRQMTWFRRYDPMRWYDISSKLETELPLRYEEESEEAALREFLNWL